MNQKNNHFLKSLPSFHKDNFKIYDDHEKVDQNNFSRHKAWQNTKQPMYLKYQDCPQIKKIESDPKPEAIINYLRVRGKSKRTKRSDEVVKKKQKSETSEQ